MVKLSKNIIRKASKVIKEYKLIENEDNILVGLSGGKDSLNLVHFLKDFQKRVPINFNFKALTISYGMGENFDELIKHCKKYDIDHEIFETKIFELSKEKIRKNSSFCSFFSRMRRGSLYSYAKKNNFNKLALGHHLDDIAESFFMNLFYNGALRTMPPKYKAYNGIEVIRPLINIRERQLKDCVDMNQIPTIGDEACPAMNFDVKMPYARFDMKKILKDYESKFPNLFLSLQSAFNNIDINSFLIKE